jgi:hypothetical protein
MWMASTRRRAVPDRQRGSVLMLMPAAVLVFLVLGALAVDYGSVFSTHRDLANAAAAAANDAATQALDIEHFYETGELRLLAERAWRIAEDSLASRNLERLDARVEDVRIGDGGTSVVVTVRGRARYLFAKAVPGGSDGLDVTASSEAHAADLPG